MVVSRRSALPAGTVDRLLVGVCAVIWLGVIGFGVAAIVVLVDMGSGRHSAGDDGSQTPWLLYAVIAVSALIIAAAVPLLVRARRGAQPHPPRGPVTGPAGRRPGGAGPGVEPPTEKLRASGPSGRQPPGYRAPTPPPRRLSRGLAEDMVNRMWLRATVVLAGAIGIAMLAVTAATYLMGVDKDAMAWVAFGVAAVVTVAMPVIPWLYLRQLRSTLGARPA